MVYERIKNLRQDNDLTQREVAQMLNISRSAYSAYENGANAVPIEVLIQLSNLYKVSIDYLLGQTNETTPYTRK